MARWLLGLLTALIIVLATAPLAHGVAANGVTVWKAGGAEREPCPDIEVRGGKVRGGCVVSLASGVTVDIAVRSMVGDMKFGTCSVNHEMRVDSRGNTRIDVLAIEGPNPCNDGGLCYRKNERPWTGKIQAAPGGQLAHVIDACLDTCMGQFAGELRLGLSRVDGSWVETADRALVGDSGYRLDGEWKIGGPKIDIVPSGEQRARRSTDGDAVAGLWRLTSQPIGWPI